MVMELVSSRVPKFVGSSSAMLLLAWRSSGWSLLITDLMPLYLFTRFAPACTFTDTLLRLRSLIPAAFGPRDSNHNV